MDYKKAGVDIEAGYKSVELMKKYVKETMRPEVMGGIGGFSGAFSLSAIKDMEDPVLLSGTDGVGTKLKLAFLMDKHDTIGIDCVAMCVNDVACAGGEPLFFLDYIACGRNIPEKIATIVKGVAEGCKQSDAALVGGETAEHPGLMPEDEYDLAGFAVGVVERKDLITGENIKPGDVLVGIASSGVHSNGFSLVRKVFDMTKESLDTYYDELGKTLGEALLAPTRIYVKAMKSVKNAGVKVKGCSHITGGGFYENIPRMLPDGIRAVVKKDSYEVPAIFRLMQKKGNITDEMMYNTYNMGLGMVLALDPADVDKTMEALKAAGETAYVVLNGNYALQAGFSVGQDALAYEKSDSEAAKTYVNVIAVKEGNENSDKIKALVDVLKSDEIKDFINEKYDGAVIPFDDSSDAADTEDADSKDETKDDAAEENAETTETAEDAE